MHGRPDLGPRQVRRLILPMMVTCKGLHSWSAFIENGLIGPQNALIPTPEVPVLADDPSIKYIPKLE